MDVEALEQTILWVVGSNVLLSSLGAVLYALWTARKHLKQFSFKIFWAENKPFWIWTAAMIALISLLLALEPEAANAIKTMTGLDLPGEGVSYVTLGIGLAGIGRGVAKVKIEKNN